MNKSFVVKFNKETYDPFLDYLKGVSIILVIITHSIQGELEGLLGFYVWGRIAVPIFLLLQVFHAYKRGLSTSNINFRYMWKRVVKSFLMVQIVIFVVVMLFSHSTSLPKYCNHILLSGGFGPGEYYPYIYIQFGIMVPIIGRMLNKMPSVWGGVYLHSVYCLI